MYTGIPMKQKTGVEEYPAYASIASLLSDYFQTHNENFDLNQLSEVLTFSLDMATNSYKAAESDPFEESDVTLASYRNGKLIISKLILRPRPISNGGVTYDRDIQPEIEVDKRFVSSTSGIDSIVRQSLADPTLAEMTDPYDGKKFSAPDPVMENLSDAIAHDGGSSLSTEEMVEIARDLEKRTASHYVEVGDDVQTAVLSNGKIESFENLVDPIKEPPKPPFQYFRFLHIKGPLLQLGTQQNGYLFVMNSSFEGMTLPLDRSLYLWVDASNCILRYNGVGNVYFDKNNNVRNSILEIGPRVSMTDPVVVDLTKRYPELVVKMAN
jgi:hypothetical protein